MAIACAAPRHRDLNRTGLSGAGDGSALRPGKPPFGDPSHRCRFRQQRADRSDRRDQGLVAGEASAEAGKAAQGIGHGGRRILAHPQRARLAIGAAEAPAQAGKGRSNGTGRRVPAAVIQVFDGAGAARDGLDQIQRRPVRGLPRAKIRRAGLDLDIGARHAQLVRLEGAEVDPAARGVRQPGAVVARDQARAPADPERRLAPRQ